MCGHDGRRYTNQCCATCAGVALRAYCSIPLAHATFNLSNPKLCTSYCQPRSAAVQSIGGYLLPEAGSTSGAV